MRHGTANTADSSRSSNGPTEAVRERFASAWRSAESAAARPRIEEYLSSVPETERATVFCTLLAVELAFRQENGEQPTPEEYLALFPEASDLIRSVFEESGFVVRDTTANARLITQARLPGMERLEGATTITFQPSADSDSEYSDGRTPGKGARTLPLADIGGHERNGHPSFPIVPGYDILRQLGVGGMGIVYKARHLQLRRLVALKMIRSDRDLSPEMLDRFRAEAEAVARFQHPHIVQIHDVGEHDGRPYFSLELLEGGNLREQLDGTPQPYAKSADLVEILARALDYAHDKNVVHRDLKPANIMLAADGTPKISDFGLAKLQDRDLGHSEDGEILGTPSYMAPEQAWGQSAEVGPRADVYALGVILYEMLTGRPPFKAAEKYQTLHLVRTQDPVSPRQMVPQIPRDLELICLKCLKKDHCDRFATALELAEELRRFGEGRPILTRPAPVWERAWKWSKRQPALASLIAVSFLALLSLMLYLEQRAKTAERIGEIRDKVQDLRFQAQQSADKERLQEALGYLSAGFRIIQAEPLLADLKPSFDALQTEVQLREEEQQGQTTADATYRDFFRRRDAALFHGMVLTGVDLAVNVPATIKECKEAIALFHVGGAANAGPSFSKYLTPEQKRQCGSACYELLMVWAEAQAQPAPGSVLATPNQLKDALRLLDQASQIEDVPSTSAFHLRRARYLELLGEADAARVEQARGADKPPRKALDLFLTGDSLRKQGRVKEAAEHFEKALRDEPDHFWARYFLAFCNLETHQPARARDNLTACVKSRPDFLYLYLYRGFAHGQMNQFAEAEDDFRRALTLKPDSQALCGILLNQGDLCLRQARLLEIPIALPWLHAWTPNLEFAGRAAAEWHRQERLAAAARFSNEAIALQPKQYPAYRQLALVCRAQNRPTNAFRCLAQAIEAAQSMESSPQLKKRVLSQLYSQRARWHRQSNQLDKARADLDAALLAFPSAEDHAERGRILFALYEDRQALEAYEAALRLRPEDAELYRWKAEACLALRMEADAVKALDHYFARGGPRTADIYRMRGLLRARLRQLPAALADYAQALALQPDSATHASRGWVYLAGETVPMALSDFEEAIRLDGKNAEAYAGRGLIRVRLGHYKAALADADAALLHDRSKKSRLLWNVAHIYAQIAGRLAIDPGAQDALTGLTRHRCQKKALEMLQLAVERVPEQEQAAFWREFVEPDALLQPLRGSAGYSMLARKYATAPEIKPAGF